MLINVTEQHIKMGQKKRASCCPIALAASEQTNMTAIVSLSDIMFKKDEVLYGPKTELPEIACQFIFDFDEGQPVQPFSFELDDKVLDVA